MLDYSELTPEQIAEARSYAKVRAGNHWIWTGDFKWRKPVFRVGKRVYPARRLLFICAGKDPGSSDVLRACTDHRCVNPAHTKLSVSHVRTPVALPPAPEYNEPQRNQFSLSLDGDAFRGALAPLRHGRSVSLVMEDARYAKIKNYQGTKAKRLVFLVPGQLLGIDTSAVLVSVVGSGSCIVWPKRKPKSADLVLAGMPAKLADVLMEKLHRIFQE